MPIAVEGGDQLAQVLLRMVGVREVLVGAADGLPRAKGGRGELLLEVVAGLVTGEHRPHRHADEKHQSEKSDHADAKGHGPSYHSDAEGGPSPTYRKFGRRSPRRRLASDLLGGRPQRPGEKMSVRRRVEAAHGLRQGDGLTAPAFS